MRNIILSALILFVFIGNASAKLFFPNLLSYHTLQKRVHLEIFFLVPLGENGFLVGGKDNYSEYIMKTDAQGRKMWDYVAGGDDYPNYTSAALATRDGKYLLAGTSRLRDDSTNLALYDIIRLTALNIAGTLEWQNTYFDTTYNVPVCLGEMDDGSILVAGNVFSDLGRFYNCLFIKTDAKGALVSRKWYGIATENEKICGLEKTPDNNFLVLAHKEAENTTWLLKVNQSADTVWTKTFYYKAGNRLNSIRRTNDGNYICAGTCSEFAGKANFWVMKIDGSGNALWNKTYNRTGSDVATSIDTVPDGGYCFAGNSGNHVILMRIGPSGDSLWTVDYGFETQSVLAAMSTSPDGRYAMAGTLGEYRETSGFMMIFENENKSVKYPEFDNWEIIDTGNSALITNQISIMAVDSNNRLWIGVNAVNNSSTHIMYRDGTDWKKFEGLPERQLVEIVAQPSGCLWFAGGPSIFRYDGKNIITIKPPTDVWPHAIAPLNDSMAYAGTNCGLYLVNGISVTLQADATDFLASNTVYDVAIDRSSSVWYAPFFGLAVKTGAAVVHYTAENTPFPEFRGGCLKIDAKGAIWTSSTLGLLRYANNEWSKFDSTNTALPTNGISAFTVDSSGTAYAACGQGFSNLKTKILYSYSNSPLLSNSIRCIEIDKTGNIWIGTDQGLVCIHSSPWSLARPAPKNQSAISFAPECRLFLPMGNPCTDYNGSWRYYDLTGRTLGKGGNFPAIKRGASHIIIGKKVK